MPRYAQHLTRPPQSAPIFGRDQVQNEAGGHVFKIDPFSALDRFLVLGCETGTYYVGEGDMTRRSADIILECARRDLDRTTEMILCASNGRAIKNDPSIFALALLAAQPNPSVLAILNDVCRTSTHLFSFVEQVTQFRGWGRSLREAVAKWYTDRNPKALLYQVTKYPQRNGWSHRDLLRLSHPRATEMTDAVLKYAVSGDPFDAKVQTLPADLVGYIGAVETVKKASDERLVVRMIRDFALVREHIPTKWLNSTAVWEALLYRMPPTALLRNLGKMTAIGLVSPLSEASKMICQRLNEPELLRRGRIHPFAILLAQTVYGSGRGVRGNLTWTPDQQITASLEDAFYGAFQTIEPANKSFMLGIDVSGSMGWRGYTYMGSIAGSPLKAYQAAAVMAMVQANTEPWCFPVAFSGRGKLTPLEDLSRHARLSDVLKELQGIPVGPTDCALPMQYAAAKKIPVDAFVVYTDNETWCGDTHPAQALEDYRQKMGRDAKLIACGMTATDYSVADPNDAGMLDVIGFDSTCPAVISKFAKGL